MEGWAKRLKARQGHVTWSAFPWEAKDIVQVLVEQMLRYQGEE